MQCRLRSRRSRPIKSGCCSSCIGSLPHRPEAVAPKSTLDLISVLLDLPTYLMSSPAQPIERKLAAIFAADVAGYSRLMGQDEVATLRTLAAHRAIMDRLIGEHRGRIANTAGDSVLAEFPSVVDAVQCAVQVQEALAEANEGVPEDRRMSFRIGVHVGDVMVRGSDLLGDGVNVAARLQALAAAGGVCLSEVAHGYVRKALSFAYEDLGHQTVRNLGRRRGGRGWFRGPRRGLD